MKQPIHDPHVPAGNPPYMIDLEAKTVSHPGSTDVDELHATYRGTPDNPGDITIRPRHRFAPSLDHAADVAKAQAAADAAHDTARARELLAFWCAQQGDHVQKLADKYLNLHSLPSRP